MKTSPRLFVIVRGWPRTWRTWGSRGIQRGSEKCKSWWKMWVSV